MEKKHDEMRLQGYISKPYDGTFTEDEMDNFHDDIIEVVERYNYRFGGGISLGYKRAGKPKNMMSMKEQAHNSIQNTRNSTTIPDDIKEALYDYHRGVIALIDTNNELMEENKRMGGASTMVGCVDCGEGVRPKYTVKGRCFVCQGEHLDKLIDEAIAMRGALTMAKTMQDDAHLRRFPAVWQAIDDALEKSF